MAVPVQLSFTITGDAALLKTFTDLPERVQKKVLRPALRAGAKIIQRSAKGSIHSISGVAAASLKVKAAKRSRKFKNRVTINVITSTGWFKGTSFYAAITEFGWKAGSKKEYPQGFRLGYRWLKQRIQVKPKHWFKRGAERAHAAAQAVIHKLVAEGIEREASAGASNK